MAITFGRPLPIAVTFSHVIGNHEATGDRERDDHVKQSSGNAHGFFDFRDSHFVAFELYAAEHGIESSHRSEILSLRQEKYSQKG
jgi:hypothetical protein